MRAYVSLLLLFLTGCSTTINSLYYDDRHYLCIDQAFITDQHYSQEILGFSKLKQLDAVDISFPMQGRYASSIHHASIGHTIFIAERTVAALRGFVDINPNTAKPQEGYGLDKVSAWYGSLSMPKVGASPVLVPAQGETWFLVDPRLTASTDSHLFFAECRAGEGTPVCTRHYDIGSQTVSVALTDSDLRDWDAADVNIRAAVERIVGECKP